MTTDLCQPWYCKTSHSSAADLVEEQGELAVPPPSVARAPPVEGPPQVPGALQGGGQGGHLQGVEQAARAVVGVGGGGGQGVEHCRLHSEQPVYKILLPIFIFR